MKKIILLIGMLTILGCTKTNSSCGTHNGKQLYLGSEGGCYYLSSGGNKEYVSRAECVCN